MAQYCKKLAAMSRLVTSMSWGMVALRGEPAGVGLLLNEELCGERFKGRLTLLGGDVGEAGEVFASLMESGDVHVTPINEYRVLRW
jgi:hypothetical protein